MLPFAATAQNVVTGHVKDARTNELLIGVNIVVKNNTFLGTISDIDGNFNLNTSGASILVSTSIGYITQEIAVNNRTHVMVEMLEDSQALDKVVVVCIF